MLNVILNIYRKEKEFEETMDHLQKDIDSLEIERGALRDKLKIYCKKGDKSISLPSQQGKLTNNNIIFLVLNF